MSPHWSRVIQSIIDVQKDPFVLIAEQYRIVAANAAYSRAYGVAPAPAAPWMHWKGITYASCWHASAAIASRQPR
ncbi:MAG: hypothetical protein ACOY4L_07065 [Pseudomonadota bacterium]